MKFSCFVTDMKIYISLQKRTVTFYNGLFFSGYRFLLCIEFTDIITNIDQVIISVEISLETIKLCCGHMVYFNLSLKLRCREIFSCQETLRHSKLGTRLNLQYMHLVFITSSYIIIILTMTLILQQIMNHLCRGQLIQLFSIFLFKPVKCLLRLIRPFDGSIVKSLR